MTQNWKIGLIAGILGIMAFFIPLWIMIIVAEPSPGDIRLYPYSVWYWGLGLLLGTGNIRIGVAIDIFSLLTATICLLLAIISLILSIQARRSGITNALLWLIIGLILIIFPLVELIYDFIAIGDEPVSLGGDYSFIPIPFAPIFFIIAGIIDIFIGYKAR